MTQNKLLTRHIQTKVSNFSNDKADSGRWLALAVIVIATLMVVLDASIMNIALPYAQHDLGITDPNRHWIVTAYAVAFGGLLLLGGRIGDFAGRKRALIIGLLGFAAASAICGFAVNQAMIFAARALQGVFAALLAPSALALVAVTFTDAKERAKAFGIFSAAAAGGGAIGLLLGGIITEYANWRWCLFINTPIAIIAAIAAVPLIRESRAEGNRKYDVAGTILATSGFVALVFALTFAAEAELGWFSPITLSTLTLGIATLTGFIFWQSHTDNLMLPLRIILDRNRGGAYLTSTLLSAGMFGMLLFLTYYLQINLEYKPFQTGIAFLPFAVSIVLGAMIVGRILPRTGPKPLLITGILTAAAGLIILTALNTSSTYSTTVLPAITLMGLGLGFVFASLNMTALTGVNPHDTGVASALLETTSQLGGALGVAFLNTLYTRTTQAQSTSSADLTSVYLDGYRVAFTAAAILFILAAVVVIFSITSVNKNQK